MEASPPIDNLTSAVRRTFRELGASAKAIDDMTDTHLIRDGMYCGRSFRCGKFLAMWFAGCVQFYGANGELLRTLALAEQSVRQSKAA